MCLLMTLAVTAAYMPVDTGQAAAATFNTAKKVTGFKLTDTTATSITLKWNKFTGAKGYEVYRKSSSDGKYSKIKTTTAKKYTRKGLTTNTKCWYKVRAYKISDTGAKTYSKFSKVIAAKPKLDTPASVKTVSKNKKVKITWNKVDDAGGYAVYRATSKDGSYTKLGTSSTTTYKNDSITIGKRYFYKVRAYRNVSGKKKYSSYSDPIEGMTNPAQPSSISAEGADGYVKVSWKKVTGAEGYEIYRSTSDSGTYSKIGTSTSKTYKDSSVTSGSSYYYKVRAYATINGNTIYGPMSANKYSRDVLVSNAVAWLGYSESSGKYKKIVDLYNSNLASGCSKIPYSAAWCAVYVSAVGIKSGYTDIIIRHSYCPTMMSKYKNAGNYSSSKSYIPSPGDVVFYDWNKNGVPDHVGLIASVSGNTITAIEGNKSDTVAYRQYQKGYTYLLSYGLPEYDSVCGIKYNGSSSSKVGTSAKSALSEVGISVKPDGYSDLGSEYDDTEQKVFDGVGCGEDVSEYDKMKYMIKKVRAKADTKDIDCSKSEYYAAFIYKLCQEADMNASIMTIKGSDSSKDKAWVEVQLDGKMYKVDASKEDAKPERYTPETTDYNPDK